MSHSLKQKSQLRHLCGGYPKWNITLLGVKVAQSCLTLCVPVDYIVRGILQARILE